MPHRSLFSTARQVSLAFASLAVACGAFAAPVCNGDIYLSQSATTENTYLLRNTGTPVNFVTQGQASHVYNSLAFHPTNGLYGIVTFSTELLKIDETTGASTSLGLISGLPTTLAAGGTATANYNAATFGIDGTYYVKESNNNTALYAVNTSVSPAVATAITLSQAINISDMGWVGDRLYSYGDNGQLYSIDVSNGMVTLIGSPPTTTPIPRFGSQFSGTNGLFGIDNNGTGFYKIDLTTGALTKISDAPGSSNNDGASCPTAEVLSITPPKADLQITKDDGVPRYTPGANVVYTIKATNNGPDAATGATVSDALPAGISTANWTCTADTGAACTASGTGAIKDTAVNLPMGASVTYTLTMAVPASFTGNLVNTATVQVPNGTVDPTPGNNSATDTDTPPQADMQATGTTLPTSVTAGQTVTGTITYTNAGPDAAAAATCAIPGLPAGATTVCTPASPTAAPLAAKASMTCNVSYVAPSTGTVTGTITAGTTTTDADPSNNTLPYSAATPVADMQATGTTLPSTVTAGQKVTGTITCTNAGPSDAAAATCAITGLPADATTVCTPATPTATPLVKGGTLVCTVGYTAPASGPVTATITAGTTTPDGVPSNNTLPYNATQTVAAAPPTPVPTLSQWALVVMALVMAGFAALRMRAQVGQR